MTRLALEINARAERYGISVLKTNEVVKYNLTLETYNNWGVAHELAVRGSERVKVAMASDEPILGMTASGFDGMSVAHILAQGNSEAVHLELLKHPKTLILRDHDARTVIQTVAANGNQNIKMEMLDKKRIWLLEEGDLRGKNSIHELAESGDESVQLAIIRLGDPHILHLHYLTADNQRPSVKEILYSRGNRAVAAALDKFLSDHSKLVAKIVEETLRH